MEIQRNEDGTVTVRVEQTMSVPEAEARGIELGEASRQGYRDVGEWLEEEFLDEEWFEGEEDLDFEGEERRTWRGSASHGFLVLVFVLVFAGGAVLAVMGLWRATEWQRSTRERCKEVCAPHALDEDQPWERDGTCRCDVGVELRNVGE
jgi:hypothetical protein